MYVSSYFTMVSPCPLFLVPLSSPWWGQPGHTVRLVPSLPLLSLRSLHLSLLFSFLSFFYLVSPCHFALDLSLPLASLRAFSQFSPFCGQPGQTVRLVTSLYSTYYLILLRSSPPSSLPFLPYFISFPLLNVFAQSGFAQRGNTLWPKVVLSSHVVSLFALALPMIFSRLSYVPPMPLDAWATGYFTTSSLGTLFTTECRASYTNDLCFQSPLFSFFEVWKWRDSHLCRGKKKGGGGQWSDQPVAYCPARPPELIHFLTTHLFSHSPTRTFVFQFPVSPHFSLCFLSYSKSWLVHRNLLSYFFNPYTLSLYSNSLDEIFLSPSPYPTPPPSSPFIPTF